MSYTGMMSSSFSHDTRVRTERYLLLVKISEDVGIFEYDSIFWREPQNHSSVTIHVYGMRIKATPFSADMFIKYYNIKNRAKGSGLGAQFQALYT